MPTSAYSTASFLRHNLRWILGGALLTFCSTFGQTFFISLFSASLRAQFTLSHGEFGSLYTIATLASALVLTSLGKVLDHYRTALVACAVLLGLGLAALSMTQVSQPLFLGILLFLLRLLGQGMCTHTAMTAMGRWYRRERGRAISWASIGLQIGEGVIPPLTILLIATFGWRSTWGAAAGLLIIIAAPAVYLLLQKDRLPRHKTDDEGHTQVQSWTRAQVLRDSRFYLINLALLAPPFIFTSIFFHQQHLAQIKGWPLQLLPQRQYLLAFSAVGFALISGRLIDRYGSRFLLPYLLLPVGCACAAITFGTSQWSIVLFMLASGCALGLLNTFSGSIWPELYGHKHLGAIRSINIASMVFVSAIGPGLTGYLIDLGVDFTLQIGLFCTYCAAVSLLMIPTARRCPEITPDMANSSPH